MIKGDTPNAACFNSPEEPDYRSAAHGWRSLAPKSFLIAIVAKDANVELQCCDTCGALRKIPKPTVDILSC